MPATNTPARTAHADRPSLYNYATGERIRYATAADKRAAANADPHTGAHTGVDGITVYIA